MIKIAVTGGLGCGKSTIGGWLRDRGWAVCEADEMAREAMQPGSATQVAVVAEFGPGVQSPDGSVDRPALARLAFGDAGRLARLNAIVHPAVRTRLDAWLRAREGNAAAIVPLLYEAGFDGGWDAVICVTAPLSKRMEWLASRGVAPADARMRIASQWTEEAKAARADYVLQNVGTRELLLRQTERVLRSILAR